MAATGFEVEGRQFRVRADYEAALRDKKIIDGIRGRVNFKNKDEVLKLYSQMEEGVYRFETLIGKRGLLPAKKPGKRSVRNQSGLLIRRKKKRRNRTSALKILTAACRSRFLQN